MLSPLNQLASGAEKMTDGADVTDYREGDTIEATVTLHGIAPDNNLVAVRTLLRDDNGRVIAAHSQQAPGEGEVLVTLEVLDPLATLNFLRVEVADASGAVLDAANEALRAAT